MILGWIILLVMIAATVFIWGAGDPKAEEISYSPQFLALVENGAVKEVEISQTSSGGTVLYGKTKAPASGAKIVFPDSGDKPAKHSVVPESFKVNVLAGDRLQELLEANNVPFRYKSQNSLALAIFLNLLPTLLFFVVFYFLFIRQMRDSGSSALAFGKSRARQLNADKAKVTFADVAGEDEAKEEVAEIVEFLKAPDKFTKLGGRIPRGVLLVGPPGTGKTLLAKAIAGEAGVPFFSISGSDFIEMFVGVGASRVRDMFEQGKKNAPCIIFIDEIDAVGRSRFSGIGGGHDEREQTLNQLPTEMDGFETSSGVIVMAATNRPDVLDEALLRPGRFDRQVVVDLPPLDGRVAILKVHAKKVKLAKSVDLTRVARGTPGFSGADLANLLNEAALIAARHNHEEVGMDDIDEARDKVLWGRERKSRVIDAEDRRITAIHEAGHAVVNILSPESDPVHKVTIIPRGMSLGSTMFLPTKDTTHVSRTKLTSQLAIALGGRAAEETFLPDICTGASQDIQQATKLAESMVCKWGMCDRFSPRSFGSSQEHLFLGRELARSSHDRDYSEETARAIDEEISKLIDTAHKTALGLIQSHKREMQQIVDLLLEKETVDGRDAEDILEFGRIRTPEERGEVPEEPPASSAPAEGDEPPAASSSAPAAEPPSDPVEPASDTKAEDTAEER